MTADPGHWPFAFDPGARRVLRLLRVTPERAAVHLTGGVLVARFGPWQVRTPLSNVAGVEQTGPYTSRWKAIGPHVSLADRGLTFGTNTDRGVCVRFHQPVRGADPLGLVRHPGLTVTVADPDGLATALRAAGDSTGTG